jgi:hypothetical protein
MTRDTLVLVEHSEGKIASIASQLLAIGSRLSREMKGELVVAAIGHQMEKVVEALQGHEIDRILVVDDPDYLSPEPKYRRMCSLKWRDRHSPISCSWATPSSGWSWRPPSPASWE